MARLVPRAPLVVLVNWSVLLLFGLIPRSNSAKDARGHSCIKPEAGRLGQQRFVIFLQVFYNRLILQPLWLALAMVFGGRAGKPLGKNRCSGALLAPATFVGKHGLSARLCMTPRRRAGRIAGPSHLKVVNCRCLIAIRTSRARRRNPRLRGHLRPSPLPVRHPLPRGATP